MNAVGIDLVEIKRISRSMQNAHFIEKVFSSAEISQYKDGVIPDRSAAAAFAAKEAFSKALGTGIKGFALNEISVLHDEYGAPYLSLRGNAAKAAKCYGLYDIVLSLTHTDEYAAAAVFASKSSKASESHPMLKPDKE